MTHTKVRAIVWTEYSTPLQAITTVNLVTLHFDKIAEWAWSGLGYYTWMYVRSFNPLSAKLLN